MAYSITNFPDFAPEAQKRWQKVPKSIQKRILDAVWCGGCLGAAPMELAQGRMKRGFLILKGTCKNCGKEIVRSIEPEIDP